MSKITVFFVLAFFILTLTIAKSQPSSEYFQQQVDYVIDVKLIDSTHQIEASSVIKYTNNSPDTLSYLLFHLWANAYRSNETPFAKQQLENRNIDFYTAPPDAKGGYKKIRFRADNKPLKALSQNISDEIVKIILPRPLLPGKQVTIDCDFKILIPEDFSRMGRQGQNYQITQWYPKPAVYDNQGWHPMPYLDQGEFFSEFGNYEVNITVPNNYIVAASGQLTNADALNNLKKLAQTTQNEEYFEPLDSLPATASKTKTLTYTLKNTHDFAWFASKTFLVMYDTIKLKDNNTVDVWAFFQHYNPLAWKEATTYIKRSLTEYSAWNGTYPYPTCTAVEGALTAGGGMEYPTITVIAPGMAGRSLEEVIMHEVGHNWFYGILASNERQHPWMDEGINSANEMRYMQKYHPGHYMVGTHQQGGLAKWIGAEGIPEKFQRHLMTLILSRLGFDQAADLPSEAYTSGNYGAQVYGKAAIVFNTLRSYLGNQKYDAVMHKYYDNWKFKHPGPNDLRNIMEAETGENLSWLFDDLLGSRKPLDYKIKRIEKNKDSLVVVIKNKGKIEAPYSVSTIDNQTAVTTKWVQGHEGKNTVTFANTKAQQIVIDNNYELPESRLNNNLIKTSGWLKKWEPIKITPAVSVTNRAVSPLNIMPLYGTNTIDHSLWGVGFYNTLVAEPKFRYAFLPMYSIGLNKLSGSGLIKYHILPQHIFRRVSVGGNVSAYAGYQKVKPNIEFIFDRKNWKQSALTKLTIDYNIINLTHSNLLPLYFGLQNYEILKTNLSWDKILGHQKKHLSFELKTDFGSFTLLEAEYKEWFLFPSGYSSNIRFYGGTFIENNNASPVFDLYAWGGNDYLMEEILLDRGQNTGWLALGKHQLTDNQGGSRAFVPLSSNQFMFAANLGIKSPWPLKPGIWTDFGVAQTPLADNTFFATGISFSLINDFLEIFVPMAGYNFGETRLPSSGNDLLENIRFTLKLSKLTPYKIADGLGKY